MSKKPFKITFQDDGDFYAIRVDSTNADDAVAIFRQVCPNLRVVDCCECNGFAWFGREDYEDYQSELAEWEEGE